MSGGSDDGFVIQVDLTAEHKSTIVGIFQDVVVVVKITVDDGIL